MSTYNHDVLIIDPDIKSQKEVTSILRSNSLTVVSFSNLTAAMEYIIVNTPKVIVTEILKSDTEFIEFLRALRRIGTQSIIIIHTYRNDSGYEKKFGLIYEYLIKPANPEKILNVVQDALLFYTKIQTVDSNRDDNEKWLKEQLEWLIWKEHSSVRSKKSISRVIIETIVHSIFQGMGVGSLVSYLDLIEVTMKEEGDFTRVKTKLLKNIIKNGKPIRTLKQRLDMVIEVFEKEYPLEELTTFEVNAIVHKTRIEIEPFRAIKNHTIKIEDIRSDKKVQGNRSFLEMAFRELFVNAFKYSPEDSTIHVTYYISNEGFSIIFMNSILPETRGINGIPPELENEILEPFFRINHNYDERFYEEELGFGIGLSVIQNGLNQINGKIHVYEALDHVTSKQPIKKVLAETVLNLIRTN